MPRSTVKMAVTILSLSLLLMASTIIISIDATYTENTDISDEYYDKCEDKIKDSIITQVRDIDKDKARSIAEDDDRFKAIKDVDKEFKLIAYTYSIDTNNCIGSLTNINVHYIAKRIDDGNPIKTITVVIDDKVSKVEDVREGDIIYAAYKDSSSWAGYSFYGNSYATKPIYESRARFSIPTVSKPTYPDYYHNRDACRTDLGRNPCILAVWPGLTNQGDYWGRNGIAQGGSIGDVRCNSSGCTIEYYLFFEFFPDPAFECRSNPPHKAGDRIVATVTNDRKYGGSNTSYDITVHNYSNGSGCGTFDYNFSNIPNPAYAAFIYERAAYLTRDNYSTLPYFTDNVMRGELYYDGSTKSISTPYSNGWYYQFHMVNSSTTNVAVTTVSNGMFTGDYRTSKYT
jgi:hypothetical protein